MDEFDLADFLGEKLHERQDICAYYANKMSAEFADVDALVVVGTAMQLILKASKQLAEAADAEDTDEVFQLYAGALAMILVGTADQNEFRTVGTA